MMRLVRINFQILRKAANIIYLSSGIEEVALTAAAQQRETEGFSGSFRNSHYQYLYSSDSQINDFTPA